MIFNTFLYYSFLGSFVNKNSWIDCSSLCTNVKSLQEMIEKVYGDCALIPSQTRQWITNRAILSPRNTSAQEINNLILNRIPLEVLIMNGMEADSECVQPN